MRMMGNHCCFLFILILNVTAINAIESNRVEKFSSLDHINEHHLIISGNPSPQNFRFVRNATGHIVQITGVGGKILEWLSAFYNFTYSPLQTNITTFDSNKTHKGLVDFLISNECDIVAMIVATSSRIILADFSHPPLFAPTSFLIRKPDSSLNLSAVIEPFQLWVWISIILSLIAVVLFWSLFLLHRKKISSRNSNIDSVNVPPENGIAITFYILRTLLKEPGQFLKLKTSSILLVAGSWSLAALILTNYYNTLLISYVSAPNPKPLIKSIRDLRDRPDIFLVTDKNANTDGLLSAADSGFFKELRDKLNSYPNSRCTSIPQCVNLVKSGFHVYLSGRDAFLYTAMRDDFTATGKCNLELGPESFILPTAWTTRKKSPYMESINYGLMRIREAGLVNQWIKQYRADANQCVKNKRNSKIEKDDMSPLTLRGLTGAFVVLIAGTTLALIAFAAECLFNIASNCKRAKNALQSKKGSSVE